MTRQIIKYPDGVVFTRLVDSFGRTVAEYRGKLSLKQAIKMYNGGR